jgi:flagellar biosynthetic protein FliP
MKTNNPSVAAHNCCQDNVSSHDNAHAPSVPKSKSSKILSFLKAPLIAFGISFIGLCVTLLFADPALAQAITLDMGTADGDGNGTMTGRVIQLVAIMTVLSLAPSILIMMTSFTRIIVVLSFVRTAIGIQQTPPNTVLVSLALFLTLFVMTPTLEKAYDAGIAPLINEEIDERQAIQNAIEPFREFMFAHVRSDDLILFTELSKAGPFEQEADVPIRVLIPAFMISELRRAFEIGFMLFLPFLIIDMVTASILMSMGMMMLPPIMISLPFKIIFFVMVDGWHLISGSLIQSFSY